MDRLEPGPVLAAALDGAVAAGLGGLGDDALAGVMLAARRCESRATATLLAATCLHTTAKRANRPRIYSKK